MLRKTAIIASLLTAASTECAEIHVDEDYVCFVPPDCSCTDEAPIDLYCASSCGGPEFPAEMAYRVSAMVGAGAGLCEGQLEDYECQVTQTGELELTVHTSYRRVSNGGCAGEDLLVCPGIAIECGMTPTLTAGTWTVKYGASSQTLVVPHPDTLTPSWYCFSADGSSVDPQ